MPKFRIGCYTTVSYFLEVEAPDKETVRDFYDDCDGDEFHRCEEDGWELGYIEEVHEDVSPDFIIAHVGEDDDVVVTRVTREEE